MKKFAVESRLAHRVCELSEQNLNLKATVSRMRSALEEIATGPHRPLCALDGSDNSNQRRGLPCDCHVGTAKEALK